MFVALFCVISSPEKIGNDLFCAFQPGSVIVPALPSRFHGNETFGARYPLTQDCLVQSRPRFGPDLAWDAGITFTCAAL